jgi:hypothetical protein
MARPRSGAFGGWSMRKLSSLKACVAAAGFALLGASGAQADTVLLSLINPPPYHITSYSLSFVATAADTTLSVGGYQVNTDEEVYDNSVTTSGGPNLLGGAWTFVPAASGSHAFTGDHGTSVPMLIFAGTTAGDYDTFSQTFATTSGVLYTYAFTFGEASIGPSGLLVTVSDIPEPATWAMMVLGFAGLGLAGYRGTRKAHAFL